MKLNQLYITLIVSVALQGFVQANPPTLVSGGTVNGLKNIISTITENPKIAAASALGLALLHPQVRAFLKNCIIHSDENPNELRWNWDEINTEDVSFPNNFMWGAAISALQTEGTDPETGLPHSNWAHWLKHGPQELKLQDAGKACDSWTLYKRDIALLQELGLTSYRFSIDWSRIEPRQGEINEEALARYVQICDDLNDAGITPVVTLHHFAHPQWFEELGGFAQAENIKYFVDFSKRVFSVLGNRVGLWCTINEPNIFVMQGYIRGVYPPGKSAGATNLFSAFQLAAEVLKNLLDAHVEVYHAIKALPGGETAKIGIVHQYLKMERFHGKYSPVKASLEHIIASSFDWVHTTVIDYFKTGIYHFYVRGIINMQDNSHAERRMNSLDYVGLNYYSHPLIRVHHRVKDPIHPGQREGDVRTSYSFNLYAEGLYRAIKHVAEIGKPIYITENGAPTPDEACRELWSKRYIYALHKAMQEGCDVRGYIYWSLLDNFEWDLGYDQRFGLFTVDFNSPEKTRTLSKGAEYYKQFTLKQKAKRDGFSASASKPEQKADIEVVSTEHTGEPA